MSRMMRQHSLYGAVTLIMLPSPKTKLETHDSLSPESQVLETAKNEWEHLRPGVEDA